MAEYSQGAVYWNERYRLEEDPLEWFQPYEAFESVFRQYINHLTEVLVVGCGNSQMSERIHDELSRHVTNVDISDVVVAQMIQKYQSKQEMKFHVGDIESLDPEVFPNNRFDVVVDKGTLDSLLCGDRAEASMKAALGQIHRVLRTDGIFLYITCGTPESRSEYFEGVQSSWRAVWVSAIPKATPQNESNSGSDRSLNQAQDVHYVIALAKRT